MDEFPVVQVPVDEVLEEAEFERLYSAPTGIVVLLSIFYGTISILAVIGNSLVIWVVVTTRQMRTVTNMYIANLAFADVVIGLFCIPFQFQAALLQRWNLPWFMCGFCPFIQALTVNVSVFTLTAIAIDRHRAIINPLRARPTKWVSKLILIGIWLAAFLFATPCAIAFRVEVEHERYRENGIIVNVTRPFCMNKNLSEKQLQAYRYTLVFMQYFVPFCVISFVYIQMAVKLWGTRAPGNAQDTRDITLLRNKKKVIKMLIIVVVVFGLCWLPLQLYNILYVTFPEINEYHFISIIWFCCDWLAMSNSCYNPFIYGIYNEKFQREFNKRFATCFCKKHKLLDVPERTQSVHTRVSSIRSGSVPNSSMRIRSNLHGGVNGNGGSISAAKPQTATANINTATHEIGHNDNAESLELTNLDSKTQSGIGSNNNNNNNSNYNTNPYGSNVNGMQLQAAEVIAGEHTCVGETDALIELKALSHNAYDVSNSI
ncbi:PREDICTED: substance-P receptor-like isoform X2 [Bactrocera latifrons]|uniref:substance-P receptor-like isoform X2 n=1 Tax=Bactrocera latifrons TaxID=174628 RepID=UPI0008DE832B|nr:PREDICTED: substance-P receptor-like isoform X2 [Bactrocera latifrons]